MSNEHRQALEHELVRISGRAWGVAVGLLLGLGLFAATNVLVLKGGVHPGAHLGRLGQIFPGYDVTFTGSLVGFVYAFVIGYGFGRLLSPRRQMTAAEAQRFARSRHPLLASHVWGLGFALIAGGGLLVVTNVLLLRGGEEVGPLLGTLRIYLPGFEVSFVGSLVGFAWLGALGYAIGRAVAGIYNRVVQIGA